MAQRCKGITKAGARCKKKTEHPSGNCGDNHTSFAGLGGVATQPLADSSLGMIVDTAVVDDDANDDHADDVEEIIATAEGYLEEGFTDHTDRLLDEYDKHFCMCERRNSVCAVHHFRPQLKLDATESEIIHKAYMTVVEYQTRIYTKPVWIKEMAKRYTQKRLLPAPPTYSTESRQEETVDSDAWYRFIESHDKIYAAESRPTTIDDLQLGMLGVEADREFEHAETVEQFDAVRNYVESAQALSDSINNEQYEAPNAYDLTSEYMDEMRKYYDES